MYRYNTSTNAFAFRSASPLTNDQIARYAPSVLAQEAHESRGEKYSFIPTIQVIDGLRAEGFQPFEVRQTRCRDAGKREHTKHLVRLRHPDAAGNKNETPEIILLNSHDGTSSYQILSGLFRFVCSNGLIAGDICNDVRVRHSGNVVNDVIEGSFEVLNNLREVEGRVEQYKSIELQPEERRLLASAVISQRWDEGESPVTPDAVLIPRRFDDRKSDLWTTANIIQEAIIKGGVRGRNAKGSRTTTRAVGGVNENVRLNKALWSITDHFASLKEGQLLAA